MQEAYSSAPARGFMALIGWDVGAGPMAGMAGLGTVIRVGASIFVLAGADENSANEAGVNEDGVDEDGVDAVSPAAASTVGRASAAEPDFMAERAFTEAAASMEEVGSMVAADSTEVEATVAAVAGKS